jgi:hypothetical protein
MSQVLAHILPVALLSVPVAPALSFDFLLHDSLIAPLRELFGSVAPFALGAGISVYVFHFRHGRGSKSG